MLMAKIVGNRIVEYIDTDKPENFPDFIKVPEHIPSNADIRFYKENWELKTLEEQIMEGLIVVEDESEEPEIEEESPTEGELVRWERGRLLHELDSIVSNPLRWSGFSDEQQNALAVYRQALLDIPQQEGFPEDTRFPDKPDFLK